MTFSTTAADKEHQREAGTLINSIGEYLNFGHLVRSKQFKKKTKSKSNWEIY